MCLICKRYNLFAHVFLNQQIIYKELINEWYLIISQVSSVIYLKPELFIDVPLYLDRFLKIYNLEAILPFLTDLRWMIFFKRKQAPNFLLMENHNL